VFAAVRERFAIPRQDDLRLRDFPTLAHVIGFVREHALNAAPPGPAPGEAAPAEPASQAQASPAAETAATSSAALPEPAAPASAAEDQVVTAVLDVVESLTGYPRDLLDTDLDLEADLGVDTVKQAEVFAAVRERFAIPRQDDLRLRDFPTLAHVIGFVREHALNAAPPGPAPEQARQPAQAPAGLLDLKPAFTADMTAAERLPRRLPVPVLRPPTGWCQPTSVLLDQASRIIVMADEGGVAQALARKLTSHGATALVLEPGAVDAVERLDAWLADGPVQGVYWLAALDAEQPLHELDQGDWDEALRRRVKNLYTVVRRLDAAGELGGAGTFLVAATRMGGYHGYTTAGAVAPLGGAVTGFVKAYRRERPDVLAKAVDFPASRKTAALADALIEETCRDPGAVEIGRADGRRWSVGIRLVPFGDGSGGMTLARDTVFVVTGAAGAIVSAIVADLAAASGGTFHLLDLAPEPDPGDADLTSFATDREGFMKVIAERLAASGTRPTPVLIERELARRDRLYSALMAIEAVRAAGGEAQYHQVDLTDAGAVTAVMDDIRARHGRVDVLVHAAGLDISHAIGDKDPREYDLVFDVKAHGLFNLLHAAGDLPVGAVVAFSSVAGRFGNAGQTDYSAANDLLCKVMSSLRATRPGTRAIAIDWTAWGGLGMATKGSIPKVMARAGIKMLDPGAGIAWVRRELTSGPFSGEVIVGGELGLLTAEADAAGGLDVSAVDTAASGPMVGTITGMGVFSGLTAETTLDPAAQPFLNDHRIGSVPVLPGVMGIEAFAALARLAVPDLPVADIEQVDFLAPVKFYRDEPRTLTIQAHIMPAADGLVADCVLSASRRIKGEQVPRVTTHFTGRVRLAAARQASASEPGDRIEPPGRPGGPAAGHDDIYRVLFHGPAYRVIEEAWRRGDAAVARVATDLPADREPEASCTVTDPRLAEACFQAAGLWEIGRAGHMALPAHADRITMASRHADGTQLYAVVQPAADGFDCAVADREGNLVLRVDGYRTADLDGALPPGLIQPIHDAMTG
jgi:NAD(P)-dependent dehydrogenase (short-subunit alcohol dehydrogenase family)